MLRNMWLYVDGTKALSLTCGGPDGAVAAALPVR